MSGSTKISVLRDVGPLVPAGVHFVPGHPLAGTEFSGPDAGFATLFDGRWTLVVPPAGTNAEAVGQGRGALAGLGAKAARMEPRITTRCGDRQPSAASARLHHLRHGR